MVEYWNVVLIKNNKEVAFSLTLLKFLSSRINQKANLLSFQNLLFHNSNIPVVSEANRNHLFGWPMEPVG
jgi:hypothetical protein